MIRQLEHKKEGKNIKDVLIGICNDRNDELAEDIRMRLLGAVSDLHAADARYHVHCRNKFTAPKAIALAAVNSEKQSNESDMAYDNVIRTLKHDEDKIWNSVELHALYLSNGGSKLNRKTLIKSLKEDFGKSIVVLSSPGYANIVTFHGKAASILRLAPDDEGDDMQQPIAKV